MNEDGGGAYMAGIIAGTVACVLLTALIKAFL